MGLTILAMVRAMQAASKACASASPTVPPTKLGRHVRNADGHCSEYKSERRIVEHVADVGMIVPEHTVVIILEGGT